MELSIIVYSCWKNRDMWKIFSRLFKKYWSECPYAVILVTDRFEDEGESYAFSKVVEINDTWARMIKKAIRLAETPYVMLWMDDYLLCDYVCNDDIQKQVERAKKFHAANIRLIESPKRSGNYKRHDNIGFYKNGQAYSISTQVGIWDVQFLNKLIDDNWSAWDFERIASMSKINFRQPLLVALDYVFPYEEGVRRGKWMVSGVNLCKRNGIKLDSSTRPIMSNMEMAKIYLGGVILDWNPNFILKVQNLIYEWRRRKGV